MSIGLSSVRGANVIIGCVVAGWSKTDERFDAVDRLPDSDDDDDGGGGDIRVVLTMFCGTDER